MSAVASTSDCTRAKRALTLPGPPHAHGRQLPRHDTSLKPAFSTVVNDDPSVVQYSAPYLFCGFEAAGAAVIAPAPTHLIAGCEPSTHSQPSCGSPMKSGSLKTPVQYDVSGVFVTLAITNRSSS